MNINNKVTAALIALGLVSAASAANASTTYTDTANLGGLGANTVYNVVYVTGSTAFRTNFKNACASEAGPGAGGVFDTGKETFTQSVGSSQIAYWGKINGTPYIIDCDFTGSEAGIASLVDKTITYSTSGDTVTGAPNPATLPGTPQPTGFVNPANGAGSVTAAPDLSFADTSEAVSLTSSAALTDYGIVAVIPFEMVKGKDTGTSTSYSDLVNISIPQLIYLLPAGKLSASFFTGNANDTENVYLIGRNEGSGTRVNTTLEAQYPSPSKFTQYVASTASYVSGVLTAASPAALSAPLKTVGQGYEGYDSGGGVANDLSCDTKAENLVTVGYLGLSDAATAIGNSAVALTLDGVAENDENVINGEYSFWGHEHLYGAPGQSSTSPGGVVANVLDGGVVNDSIYTGWTPTTGALEESFQSPASGGNENPPTAQSLAVDPGLMACDKPSDAGYPSQ
jgi:hypothetical protein